MNQSSLWTCESLRHQCKTPADIVYLFLSLARHCSLRGMTGKKVVVLKKRLDWERRGEMHNRWVGEVHTRVLLWVWGKHQVQYYTTMCVCLTNIRHTGLERVPGWDQVSAAASRDNTGIGCFPPSNSITHHLLHPCFHSLPVLLFHIYLSAPSFSLHSSQPPSLISSLAASLFDSFLFYLFVLFLHRLLIASLVFSFTYSLPRSMLLPSWESRCRFPLLHKS